jgi:hypothetical protein
MNNLIKIENEPSYVKDELTSAIINTDVNLLAEYKSRKRNAQQLKDMQSEINSLKQEIEIIRKHLGIG